MRLQHRDGAFDLTQSVQRGGSFEEEFEVVGVQRERLLVVVRRSALFPKPGQYSSEIVMSLDMLWVSFDGKLISGDAALVLLGVL